MFWSEATLILRENILLHLRRRFFHAGPAVGQGGAAFGQQPLGQDLDPVTWPRGWDDKSTNPIFLWQLGLPELNHCIKIGWVRFRLQTFCRCKLSSWRDQCSTDTKSNGANIMSIRQPLGYGPKVCLGPMHLKLLGMPLKQSLKTQFRRGKSSGVGSQTSFKFWVLCCMLIKVGGHHVAQKFPSNISHSSQKHALKRHAGLCRIPALILHKTSG